MLLVGVSADFTTPHSHDILVVNRPVASVKGQNQIIDFLVVNRPVASVKGRSQIIDSGVPFARQDIRVPLCPFQSVCIERSVYIRKELIHQHRHGRANGHAHLRRYHKVRGSRVDDDISPSNNLASSTFYAVHADMIHSEEIIGTGQLGSLGYIDVRARRLVSHSGRTLTTW